MPGSPEPAGGAAGRGARRVERAAVAAAAGLAVAGFLAYYLPVYRAPTLFPTVQLALPGLGTTVAVRWGETLWALVLTAVELGLLTALNVAGVRRVAAATGFLTARTARRTRRAILGLGLERKATALGRYGIDPFEGLSPVALFLFNTLVRLKGWLANQAVRFLVRWLLGRYAVRAVLDFAGLPVYMALNAYAAHAVLREARVVLLGRTVVARFLRRVPPGPLRPGDARLVYDTLQYVAVSKRDFHRNHYALTRGLLARLRIPREPRHPLPPDYLDRLARAEDRTAALCQAVVLLGFVLDGRLSRRERRRLWELNARGLLREREADVAGYAQAFLRDGGVEGWLPRYLARMGSAPPSRAVGAPTRAPRR